MKLLKPAGKPFKRHGCNYCNRGVDGLICDDCVAKFMQILRSSRWRKARIGFLTSSSENSLCRRCRAIDALEPATDVHHTKPWRNYPTLFWKSELWEGLCHSCHSTETAKENGFGKS